MTKKCVLYKVDDFYNFRIIFKNLLNFLAFFCTCKNLSNILFDKPINIRFQGKSNNIIEYDIADNTCYENT